MLIEEAVKVEKSLVIIPNLTRHFSPLVKHNRYRGPLVHSARLTYFGLQTWCGRVVVGKKIIGNTIIFVRTPKWEETTDDCDCKCCLASMQKDKAEALKATHS